MMAPVRVAASWVTALMISSTLRVSCCGELDRNPACPMRIRARRILRLERGYRHDKDG